MVGVGAQGRAGHHGVGQGHPPHPNHERPVGARPGSQRGRDLDVSQPVFQPGPKPRSAPGARVGGLELASAVAARRAGAERVHPVVRWPERPSQHHWGDPELGEPSRGSLPRPPQELARIPRRDGASSSRCSVFCSSRCAPASAWISAPTDQSAGLSSVVDVTGQALALYATDGRELAQNPVMRRVLGQDPEREAVREHLRSVVKSVLASLDAQGHSRASGDHKLDGTRREVATSQAAYRLRGNLVGRNSVRARDSGARVARPGGVRGARAGQHPNPVRAHRARAPGGLSVDASPEQRRDRSTAEHQPAHGQASHRECPRQGRRPFARGVATRHSGRRVQLATRTA